MLSVAFGIGLPGRGHKWTPREQVLATRRPDVVPGREGKTRSKVAGACSCRREAVLCDCLRSLPACSSAVGRTTDLT